MQNFSLCAMNNGIDERNKAKKIKVYIWSLWPTIKTWKYVELGPKPRDDWDKMQLYIYIYIYVCMNVNIMVHNVYIAQKLLSPKCRNIEEVSFRAPTFYVQPEDWTRIFAYKSGAHMRFFLSLVLWSHWLKRERHRNFSGHFKLEDIKGMTN